MPVERAAGTAKQQIEVIRAAPLGDGLLRLANRLLEASGAERFGGALGVQLGGAGGHNLRHWGSGGLPGSASRRDPWAQWRAIVRAELRVGAVDEPASRTDQPDRPHASI